MGVAVPGLVALGSVEKQAEQAMRVLTISSTLHGLRTVCVSLGLPGRTVIHDSIHPSTLRLHLINTLYQATVALDKAQHAQWLHFPALQNSNHKPSQRDHLRFMHLVQCTQHLCT